MCSSHTCVRLAKIFHIDKLHQFFCYFDFGDAIEKDDIFLDASQVAKAYSLLKAYNAIHTYDIICLLETYLNHDTLSDNDNLKIPGYELIRADHPSNQKRGGICISHKDFLPIKVKNVSCLKECLNFSLSVYGKQCNITLIYHSPSQSSEEFDTFLS